LNGFSCIDTPKIGERPYQHNKIINLKSHIPIKYPTKPTNHPAHNPTNNPAYKTQIHHHQNTNTTETTQQQLNTNTKTIKPNHHPNSPQPTHQPTPTNT